MDIDSFLLSLFVLLFFFIWTLYFAERGQAGSLSKEA